MMLVKKIGTYWILKDSLFAIKTKSSAKSPLAGKEQAN
jgi:hypothetical protein